MPKPTIGAGSENGFRIRLAADCGAICRCCKCANKIRNETSHLITSRCAMPYRVCACYSDDAWRVRLVRRTGLSISPAWPGVPEPEGSRPAVTIPHAKETGGRAAPFRQALDARGPSGVPNLPHIAYAGRSPPLVPVLDGNPRSLALA